MTRRATLLGLCVALLLGAAACSSVREEVTGSDANGEDDEVTEVVTPRPTWTPRPQVSPSVEDLTLRDKDRKARNTDDEDGAGAVAAPMGPPGAQKPPPELEPQGEGGPDYARLSARASEGEPDGRREGDPPDYAEARAVDVEGLGNSFRVTITFFGEVPQRMPTDQTFMVIGFGMSGETKNDDDYGFGARASRDGWLAYAGSRGSASQFPGTFFVRGNRIEMNIPWRAVGGPRPFQWYANSSWFEQREDAASYLFDPIPNGRANYPD